MLILSARGPTMADLASYLALFFEVCLHGDTSVAL